MEKKATDSSISFTRGTFSRVAKHVSGIAREICLYVVQGIFFHRLMIRSGSRCIVWAVRYSEVSGITGSVIAGVDCTQHPARGAHPAHGANPNYTSVVFIPIPRSM